MAALRRSRASAFRRTACGAIAEELSGLDLSAFFARYVDGTEELPLAEMLGRVGIDVHLRPADGNKDKGGKPGRKAKHRRRRRAHGSARGGPPATGADHACVRWRARAGSGTVRRTT